MKRIAGLLLSLFASFLLLAGGASAAPTGKMTIARGGWVDTLDPHLQTSFVLTETLPYLFDRLLAYDPKTGEIRPHLAGSYRYVSPTLVEFTLRRDVKFSNGEPVNAQAVKFSLERIIDPKNKSTQREYFRNISMVEAAGEHTVRLHLKEPDALIIRMVAAWGFIAPPKYYSSHDNGYLARNPVGSGPYKLARWNMRQEIVLEARKDYWEPGLPKIETGVIKEIPEAATRLAALLAGDVDMIDRVPPQMVERIRQDPNLEVIIHFAPRVASVNMIVKEKPLSDVRVRQALNYAVDRDSLIKHVLQGYARKIPLLQIPESFGWNSKVQPYPYDPAKARKLLAEAGYPNGFDIDLYVPVGRYFMGETVADAAGGYFRKVGVRATVKPIEWGAFRRLLNARWKPESKGFMWFGARFDTPLDADWMMGMVTPATAFGGFNDPEVNQRVKLGRATTDMAKRKAIYHELNEMLKEKAPVVFMYQESAVYAKKRHVVVPDHVDGPRLPFIEGEIRR